MSSPRSPTGQCSTFLISLQVCPALLRRSARNAAQGAYTLDRMTIDGLDARLIETLRDNPRVGLLEVARRLGVARGTVQARLVKLEARGVITGHGPEVDPAAMGYPIAAFMLIELAQGRLGVAVPALEAIPEALEAVATRRPLDRI